MGNCGMNALPLTILSHGISVLEQSPKYKTLTHKQGKVPGDSALKVLPHILSRSPGQSLYFLHHLCFMWDRNLSFFDKPFSF